MNNEMLNMITEPIFPEIWGLQKDIIFFNHGSFGSCPKPILQYQDKLRAQMESQPVQFFVRDYEKMLDEARICMAQFVDADPNCLVFVPNVTYGVNCVFNSLEFHPGDEILITNHEYNACKNIAEYTAQKTGAKTVVAKIPFPLNSQEEIFHSIMSNVTTKTRAVLIDHITSPTALIFPIEKILCELKKKEIPLVIDGSHAPGMLPLSIKKLDPDFYTANCHKWLCSPKGAGFLYVNKKWINKIRPITISHGANTQRTDRSRFLIEFGWTGTDDPTPYFCIPEVIKYFNSIVNNGWDTIMKRNHSLAIAAREIICNALDIKTPAPAEIIGSMATIPMWDSVNYNPSPNPLYMDALQTFLWENYKIEVPIMPWENYPKRVLRISAQIYNSLPQYEKLAKILKDIRNKNI